jgi:hypothetical protein
MAEDAKLMRAAHCYLRARSRGEEARTARRNGPRHAQAHTPAPFPRRGVKPKDLPRATSEIEKMTRRFISKKKADEIGRKMGQVLGS